MEIETITNSIADIQLKEYWSYEDICRLFGKISRNTFNQFRYKHNILYRYHPMNRKAIPYRSCDVIELLNAPVVNVKMSNQK